MGVIVGCEMAVSLAANTKGTERVSGTYQTVGPGTITLMAKGSATGMNHTLLLGGIPIINDQAIPSFGTTGTMSRIDSTVLQYFTPTGGKIEYAFRNASAGTLTADYQLEFEPGKRK